MPAPRTVLIADDESMVRLVARLALAAEGWAAAEAEDAAAAVDAVRAADPPFGLVLLDLGLTGERGALVSELRALSPGLRVLVVSGSHADDALDLRADGFLSKPFTRVALLEAVRRALATAS
jgi:DNA-binding response OmpR family regulator